MRERSTQSPCTQTNLILVQFKEGPESFKSRAGESFYEQVSEIVRAGDPSNLNGTVVFQPQVYRVLCFMDQIHWDDVQYQLLCVTVKNRFTFGTWIA